MAAVIRIKRNLNEDPLDTVLFNCKRRKTEDSGTADVEDLSTVLKFAGTVDNPEEDVFKHIKKPSKAETEEQYKKHTTNIIKKLRRQKEFASKNNRYKVVNSFRSSNCTVEQSKESDISCTVVDIETDQTNKDVGNKENSDVAQPQYVYDLYYTNSDDFGEADLNEFVSVYPLSDGVIYDARDDGYNNESDTDDSEDSNAEDNWKNDYPDESDVESPEERDEDESIAEADMLRAMHKVALDDDEDLSSDDYDGSFSYDREEEFEHSYAKYKPKVVSRNNDFCYFEEYDESCTP